MSVSRRAFTIGLGAVPLSRGKTSAPQEPVAKSPTADSVAPPSANLFDEHELATVAAIAELIIPATDTPGAKQAQVAGYLDRILSDSPEPVRTSFLQGLWWTDGYCQRSAGVPFKDLSSSDQLKIISDLHDSSDPEKQTGRSFVRDIKIWTARIYYSTEIGEQELNKGGRVPSTYVKACE